VSRTSPLYRRAERRHILPAMTTVHCDYKPNRPRKKPRHYGEIRYGVADEAQRTELIRQFMARTLKGGGDTSHG
jgi:hypothetical protein